MMQLGKTRFFILAVACLGMALVDVRNSSAQDPVDDLQKALFMRPEERRNPTDAMLAYRRASLEKRIAALRTIADLRRGLTVWKTDPDLVRTNDPRLQKQDEEMRSLIGERLRKSLQSAAKDSDPNTRLAVANLIAEMGPTVRALDPVDFSGYARSLEPIVIDLVRDKDLGVRQEALRALGNINAEPKIAVPIFVQVLQTDTEEAPRRLAAGGLVQMVKVVNHLQGQAKTGIFATPAEMADAATRVIGGAGSGLSDTDAQVRALCLDAIQAAANAYVQLPGAYKKTDFPPAGRPLTQDEINDIKLKYDAVRKSLAEIQPVLKAIADQGRPLAQSLLDPETRVRQSAVNALEDIGQIRLRIRQRRNSLPPLPNGAAKNGPDLANPLDGLVKELLPGVITILDDPDVTVRRRAVEFLEQIEDDAAPAIAGLVDRLRDHDRFTRWAAARTLGNFEAKKVQTAVTALAMLVHDPDLDVRLAAVRSLEGMGPYARAAVPYLVKGILVGDPEIRIGVMYALASVGPEHTQAAIPNLIKSLNYDLAQDARVRQTAAEVLGKFGPAASAAVPALRQALGDDDAEVRARASDALLNILVPAK